MMSFKYYKDGSARQAGQFDLLTSPSLEEEPDSNTIFIRAQRSGTHSIPPKLTLPAKSIDRWPTFVHLKTPGDLYFVLDGLPVDQQATLVVPVVQIAQIAVSPTNPGVLPSAGESYIALIRKLVKNSAIYALASFVAPFISLILAPFLTHNLTHDEYGALAVLNTTIALVSGITQFGLNSAFFRAYSCDYESKRDRLGVLSTVVVLLLLVSIPVTITVAITAPWLSTFVLNTVSFSSSIRLAALIILLQNLTVPGFAWLRAENRAAFFSVLSIVNLLFTLGASIILVGTLQMGIDGSLLATGIGYAAVVLCTLPIILLRAGLLLRFDIAQNLLSFGLPLVSNFVSSWVLQLSDRYLLSRLGSLGATASYAVAYSLGGVLGVLVLSPFMLAWPSVMFTLAKRKDATQAFQLVFRWFSLALLFSAFALSRIGAGALNLFFPPAYQAAAPIIPIIAASILFYGIYNVFTVGISVQRKTWFAVIFTTFAALVNIGMNILLIPLYGSLGAALSTLAAYLLLALVAYVVNQRIYLIPFEVSKFVFALFLGIALYIGAGILSQTQGQSITWGIHVVSLIFYAGCLLLIGKGSMPVCRKINRSWRFLLYENTSSIG